MAAPVVHQPVVQPAQIVPPPGKVAKVITKEVPYTVMVPITKTRTEEYTVAVPVVEQRSANYQVVLPDGSVEIRTRTYNVTTSRPETRTREVQFTEMVAEQRTRTVQSTIFVDAASSSDAALAKGYQGANGINVENLRDILLEIVKENLGGDPKQKTLGPRSVVVDTINADDFETYTVTCTITGENRTDVEVKVEAANVSTTDLNGWAQTISSALQPQETTQREMPQQETAAVASSTAPRYWTRADGKRSVLASFAGRADADNVILVRHADDKKFKFAINLLSERDILFLTRIQSAASGRSLAKLD
jgi:hypothetical protein